MSRIKGSPKTGGRVAGRSLDKQARQLVSAELAGSILATFERLGGADDMVKWAADNRTVFYTQILARLYPAAAKDDEPMGGTLNQQFSFNKISDREAACRISFVLNSAVYGDPSISEDAPLVERVTVTRPEMTPQEACRPQLQPEPIDNPAQAEWAASLPLTPQERQDQKLVKQTREASITNYAGSSAEQGSGAVQRQPSGGKPTVNELRRRQLL